MVAPKEPRIGCGSPSLSDPGDHITAFGSSLAYGTVADAGATDTVEDAFSEETSIEATTEEEIGALLGETTTLLGDNGKLLTGAAEVATDAIATLLAMLATELGAGAASENVAKMTAQRTAFAKAGVIIAVGLGCTTTVEVKVLLVEATAIAPPHLIRISGPPFGATRMTLRACVPSRLQLRSQWWIPCDQNEVRLAGRSGKCSGSATSTSCVAYASAQRTKVVYGTERVSRFANKGRDVERNGRAKILGKKHPSSRMDFAQTQRKRISDKWQELKSYHIGLAGTGTRKGDLSALPLT